MDIAGMGFISYHYRSHHCFTTMPNNVISCPAMSPALHDVAVCGLLCAKEDQVKGFDQSVLFCKVSLHDMFQRGNKQNRPKLKEDSNNNIQTFRIQNNRASVCTEKDAFSVPVNKCTDSGGLSNLVLQLLKIRRSTGKHLNAQF